MKFFTDNTVRYLEWGYELTNIKKYLKMRVPNYIKEMLIDPAVYELIDSKEYSWVGKIDIEEFLDSLPNNHYFSFDYPSDMNPQYEDLFLMKSYENAEKYTYHPQYITTVQGKFNNYYSYIEWFHKYNDLEPEFLGLGNICKQRSWNTFLKHTIPYIFKYSYTDRIHIYGLCKDAIPKVYQLAKKYRIDISIDQVKWQYYKDSTQRPQHFKFYLIDLIDEGVKFQI
jgi:hypothetical protein